MKSKVALVSALAAAFLLQAAPNPKSITILRDDWGIAHVYGKTDADAVFGMIYAQAEDDFNRIEVNYLNSMGRLAEAEGEAKIYQDLRMKLFIDPADLQREYAASPAWLKKLMDAWADGLNYYLAKHKDVKPRVIQKFEPWMALSFTEGSIGGDIERINLGQLEALYGKVSQAVVPAVDEEEEPGGSNGIAIAPANTVKGHALLLINPHTSFFFRSELQMTSREGLNAYGAVTWGQFFIYQGFNERAGWMHTSSGVDAVDEYLEPVNKPGFTSKEITVPYKTATGMAEKKFTVFYTSHGPVIREQDGQWVSISLMREHVKALMQSYSRTKARTYQEYKETMEFKANSSNNTIFADADGDIAYFHGNYIPKRDTSFDWTKPVDGTNPATEYKGLHTLEEIPHLLNPATGWIYNANDWPWQVAGDSSPKKADFPAYVEQGGPSARGRHAVMLLEKAKNFTLESLNAAAYDSYLPAFETRIPALLKAWDDTPVAELAEQIKVLRAWDYRWAADSVATSLAIFYGEETRRNPKEPMLEALAAASNKLAADFGAWRTPWGEINRYQRLNSDIVQPFSDAGASIPVPFTSSVWGSLASFGAHAYPGTKKWYGTSGNSFVAVVEFGAKVRAKAVTAGGESGHPDSKHFNDEAQRYVAGQLRDVYFYKSDLKGHTERQYHP